ncbi:MAG: alpha/beta hydrolase [Pseudomonadota bacterium]
MKTISMERPLSQRREVFPRLRSLATLVIFSAVLLCGCSQESSALTTETDESPNTHGLQFERRSNASRLIVFVHGFMGDARDTWVHDRTQARWPAMLVGDSAFADADVAVYGYSSSVFEQSFSIDEVADNLRLRLTAARVPTDYDEVVFLTHSMGGLVVRAFALKYRDLVEIPMIYFYGTPTNGADLGNIASLLPGSKQAEGLQELEKNAFLQSQNSQWLASSQHQEIRSYCGYETKTTRGVTVVPRSSATALCNQRLDPIPENHIRMVKPASKNADAYVTFKVAYQETFERQQITEGQRNIEISTSDFSFPNDGNVLVADRLTISVQSYTAPPDTLIVANSVEIRDGSTLRGSRLSIVAGSVIGGAIDVSGSRGDDAGELLVAGGRVLGTRLIAVGGAGIDGADGADGPDGSAGGPGAKGRCDGFGRWRKARNGGNGTAGGDGGDGENGGDGGDGGTVYLVSLAPPAVSPLVGGGEAGEGGSGGRAGRGGPGGSGGRGCTGLGGAQENASSGTDGLDGRPGRSGSSGDPGRVGTVWIGELESLADIAQHIPPAAEIVDYRTDIVERLKGAARAK